MPPSLRDGCSSASGARAMPVPASRPTCVPPRSGSGTSSAPSGGRSTGRTCRSGAVERRGASRPWRCTRGGRDAVVRLSSATSASDSPAVPAATAAAGGRCHRRTTPSSRADSPGCGRRCRGTAGRGTRRSSSRRPCSPSREIRRGTRRRSPMCRASEPRSRSGGARRSSTHWNRARRGHPLARARAASRSRHGVGVPRAGPAFPSTSCYGTRRSTRWWPRTRAMRKGWPACPDWARARWRSTGARCSS